MEEISFKDYISKSGQMLEKYRSNIDHLSQLRHQIEKQFFTPEEMVEFFYQNKSEFFTWQATQESISSLEEAYNDLVGSMMDAINDPESYKFYLRDQRIPVLVQEELEEVSEEDLDFEE